MTIITDTIVNGFVLEVFPGLTLRDELNYESKPIPVEVDGHPSALEFRLDREGLHIRFSMGATSWGEPRGLPITMDGMPYAVSATLTGTSVSDLLPRRSESAWDIRIGDLSVLTSILGRDYPETVPGDSAVGASLVERFSRASAETLDVILASSPTVIADFVKAAGQIESVRVNADIAETWRQLRSDVSRLRRAMAMASDGELPGYDGHAPVSCEQTGDALGYTFVAPDSFSAKGVMSIDIQKGGRGSLVSMTTVTGDDIVLELVDGALDIRSGLCH
jgi:hypothetical protein